jgi:replicative DNA helicase
LDTSSGINVFYSYSHKDESLRENLEEHLKILHRNGLIASWTDRKIVPGDEWKRNINENLKGADLILLLISSSFIASDYCYENELNLAMSLHESGQARVIPIFVRPADWKEAPFASLQGLPNDAIPVTLWENADLAWQNIAGGLRVAIQEIKEKKNRPSLVNRMKTLQEAISEDVDRLDSLYDTNNHSYTEGLSTGFSDLDMMTNGLQKGELFVIASRPTMGKTSLALNIAASVADEGLPVLIFSTKLRAVDVSRRLITLKGKINYARMGTGTMADEDWPKLLTVIQGLNTANVLIDDSPTLSFADLRNKCLKEKEQAGALALIVIDSLEYLRPCPTIEKARYTLGKALKLLARELDSPIVISCNVSRQVEQRPNKRPVPRDIDQDSGLFEEADVITFLYLDSHYNFESAGSNTAEIIVAKNQFGPIGTIRLSHLAAYGAFQPYTTS